MRSQPRSPLSSLPLPALWPKQMANRLRLQQETQRPLRTGPLSQPTLRRLQTVRLPCAPSWQVQGLNRAVKVLRVTMRPAKQVGLPRLPMLMSRRKTSLQRPLPGHVAVRPRRLQHLKSRNRLQDPPRRMRRLDHPAKLAWGRLHPTSLSRWLTSVQRKTHGDLLLLPRIFRLPARSLLPPRRLVHLDHMPRPRARHL